MATYSSTFLASFLLVLALVIFTRPSKTSAVSCTEALVDLLPCEAYLVGVGNISAPCCTAAQTVAQAATTQQDRKLLCQCFKQASLSSNINTDRAQQLPQLCKINLPVTISPSIDCDTIA